MPSPLVVSGRDRATHSPAARLGAAVRTRRARATTAAASAATLVALSLLFTAAPGAHAAASAGRPSAEVAVIPGFRAPHYPNTDGVPLFPASNVDLTGYHFSALGASAVTPQALQPFDTVVLYGIRWIDLAKSAQQAINAFAQTGKVIIWDADASGSQNYTSFVHAFTTTASGEGTKTNLGSAVSFPSGSDPLASSDPASPLYLDPSALTSSNHLIEDMSVLNPDSAAPDWTPGLIAANQVIPSGGWPLAWAYGSTGNQTGMTIYSGLDADAFTDGGNPNYAIKALAIQLATPFQRTPVAGCAPNCSPPPPTVSPGTTTGSGSTGTGLGKPGLPTFVACSFAHRPPLTWVRGRLSLLLNTGVAAGLSGQVMTSTGKLVGSGTPTTQGQLRLRVNTLLLPSNRRASLQALVLVNSTRACTLTALLKVDNTPPKLLALGLHRSAGKALIRLRTSETVTVAIRSGGHTLGSAKVHGRTTTTLSLARSLPAGSTLVLIDRAGNRATHRLS